MQHLNHLRLGDFYETFDDDAKIVANACNIVLTGREMGGDARVPLEISNFATTPFMLYSLSSGK